MQFKEPKFSLQQEIIRNPRDCSFDVLFATSEMHGLLYCASVSWPCIDRISA
jgi:hypothetical protein